MKGVFDLRYRVFDCSMFCRSSHRRGGRRGNRQSTSLLRRHVLRSLGVGGSGHGYEGWIDNRQRLVGVVVAAVVGSILVGCGEDIGPSPGVVEGDDTLSGQANSLVPYDIQASGKTHEAFSLYVDQSLVAWVKGRPPLGGVQQGYGEVAPPDGYVDLTAASAGYTYFYLTAAGEHYGKLEVLELTQDHGQERTSITFHWWLQTREGEREIGG